LAVQEESTSQQLNLKSQAPNDQTKGCKIQVPGPRSEYLKFKVTVVLLK